MTEYWKKRTLSCINICPMIFNLFIRHTQKQTHHPCMGRRCPSLSVWVGGMTKTSGCLVTLTRGCFLASPFARRSAHLAREGTWHWLRTRWTFQMGLGDSVASILATLSRCSLGCWRAIASAQSARILLGIQYRPTGWARPARFASDSAHKVTPPTE